MRPSLITVHIAPAVELPLAFFDRSSTAMGILREDGTVLYQNEASVRMWGLVTAPEDSGASPNILQWGPKDFSSERVKLMQRLAIAGQDGLVRDIWRGEQILTHLRLLPRTGDEPLRLFLLVHERVHGPQNPADFPDAVFHDSANQDLGPLALLSPRELEVLALVGEGLTAAQIAARIHRTEETVNSHKAALLRKLSCQNATQLALIAYKAGLKFDDASRLNS